VIEEELPMDSHAFVPSWQPATDPATDLLTRSSLIQGLKSFSPDRWSNFVLVYSPLLKYWIRLKGIPISAVEDVFQESLQSICTGISNFERDTRKGNFRGWLRTIVERRVADHFRSMPMEKPVAPEQLGNIPKSEQKTPELIESEQQVIEEIRLRAMELVRQNTTEKTWQMFWLSTVEQVPTADIAKEFSVSNAAVRVAKQRVLQRLRSLMTDEFDRN
jgi:RNA polymerase sigma-70 factor (ECF subfamily)